MTMVYHGDPSTYHMVTSTYHDHGDPWCVHLKVPGSHAGHAGHAGAGQAGQAIEAQEATMFEYTQEKWTTGG
jgi:hypothetical protein